MKHLLYGKQRLPRRDLQIRNSQWIQNPGFHSKLDAASLSNAHDALTHGVIRLFCLWAIHDSRFGERDRSQYTCRVEQGHGSALLKMSDMRHFVRGRWVQALGLRLKWSSHARFLLRLPISSPKDSPGAGKWICNIYLTMAFGIDSVMP